MNNIKKTNQQCGLDLIIVYLHFLISFFDVHYIYFFEFSDSGKTLKIPISFYIESYNNLFHYNFLCIIILYDNIIKSMYNDTLCISILVY